jgi:hypothetical protein
VKSLKTYNLDHDVIQILSRQPNKSQYVCRAVRRLSHNIDEISPGDFTTQQLIGALQSRFDQYSPQYQMLTTLIALL